MSREVVMTNLGSYSDPKGKVKLQTHLESADHVILSTSSLWPV